MAYPELGSIAKYGYLGVELFFLISGFVILMTARNSNLRYFVASRIGRLYPAFWVCCCATSLVALIAGDARFSVTVPEFAANLSMVSGYFGVKLVDGVYSTLLVEIQFYCLVAVLVMTGLMSAIQRCLWIWLATLLICEVTGARHVSLLLLTDYAGLFAGGAVCYLIWAHGPNASRVALLICCWCWAMYKTIGAIPRVENSLGISLAPGTVAILTTLFFLVLFYIAINRPATRELRSWTALGALTYPLYLLHQNIGYQLFNAASPMMNRHLLFWAVIGLMLVLSYAVHQWVERPLGPALANWVSRRLAKLPSVPMLWRQRGSID